MKSAIIDATNGPATPAPRTGPSPYATPIANVPLIGHVMSELSASGVDQARVIAEPEVRRDLGRILGDGSSWNVEVSYAEPSETDRRRMVLSELEQALRGGPVVLHPGNGLFRSQVVRMREQFDLGEVDAVVPQQASGDAPHVPRDGRLSDAMLVLGPATRPLVGELMSVSDGGRDLVAALLRSDCRLALCQETEHWCYSESTEALLAANRMILDALPAAATTSCGEDNQVQGRVAIHPGAVISNSVLHGPLAIDDGARIEDSFIGPYTAVGPGVLLRGTEIDNSMLWSGAEVRHPGHRIESSIIGQRARVSRRFELPKGVHLRLGTDSEVTFS